MSVQDPDSAPCPAGQAASVEPVAREWPGSELVERLPTEPGVYLMKDRQGRVIYVGKAANLRQRVRSYFCQGGDPRPFVAHLGRLLGDIETVVTRNEKEALLLENNLIKQHRPRFNVSLRDDKSFLVLRLDTRARFPRLEVMRRMRDDGARYFGPYHSAQDCRVTLRLANRSFRLRTCTDHVLATRERPCLQYQIRRCPGPCVLAVDEEEYGEQVRDLALFLDGRSDELCARLRQRMLAAAAAEEFERAAALRGQLEAVEHSLIPQRVVSASFANQDVVGYHREGEAVDIVVLEIRQGRLLGSRDFSFSGQEFPDGELLSSFLGLYYDRVPHIPEQVLLPLAIEDAAAHAEWLGERSGRRVEVLWPRRGERAELLDLAARNAAARFASRRDRVADAEAQLGKLQRRLRLQRRPRRIECFDISTLGGQLTVGSMVVFVDGVPARQHYRRFRIKSASGGDDFAALYEVVSRRLRRLRRQLEAVRGDGQQGGQGRGEQGEDGQAAPSKGERAGQAWFGEMPDLMVIDGGKGQLSAALAALRDQGYGDRSAPFTVIALAKQRRPSAGPHPGRAGEGSSSEGSLGSNPGGNAQGSGEPDRVFLPRVKDPLRLRPNTAELFLLSRIRDEAHRFAIAYHRKLRRRRALGGALREVAGVGAQRARLLLRHFGSLKRIRAASVEELAAVPGMTRRVAEAVRRFFGGAAATNSKTQA